MNPENRSLVQITIEDAVAADGVFSLLMGEVVSGRKAYIESHATYATLDI